MKIRLEYFLPLVQKAFTQLIDDKANEKLKTALDSEIVATGIQQTVSDPVEIPPPVTFKNNEKLDSFLIKTLVY